MSLALAASLSFVSTSLLGLWLWHMNKVMTTVPPDALALSPHRWTVPEIRERAAQVTKQPLNTLPHLPPATGRRYVVIGGSGFVGGRIVLHLLLRGENPKNIRIVDIRRPTRWDLLTEQASQVGVVIADVRDLDSVRAAFKAEWPADANMDKGITVIHSAAGLRYYERHVSFIGRSAMLNVEGTRNVLAAAQEAGVGIFVFTSSGTIPLKRTNFWVFPWQKRPESLVQVLDDSAPAPRKHEEFFSNYPYTKLLAENLVREADAPSKGFRTGCLRPGSAVIGWGGDLLAEEYLKRGVNPSWVRPIIQSMTYVENVSYAHLLYEARLLEAQKAPPDAPIQRLGGDTFMITDTGDPISFSDLYLALSSLTDGRTEFPPLPASPMFLLAHAIEFYYKLQSRLPWLLPPIKGEIVNVQPALFDLAMVHIKIDDSRARLPPEEGGLGYRAPWTTLDGVCQLVRDHLESERLKQEASEKKS
ncbi:hypothetical protein NLJ89_g1630 [Agrocybe chaxingu]|uniref:3-beta hydroxysteroid dehydrogenase/isomerase domain-containing protein n=1 Tax=Agrocybe chaxingu TaxID=84603 RepID=A0A9W8MZP1_9AGAR|nr:hypothetical protein NLJ89_g1630 [Agrocybe chaxingu]